MTSEAKTLLARAGVKASIDEQDALNVYWSNMKRLREAVDETALADNEIAVTYHAVSAS